MTIPALPKTILVPTDYGQSSDHALAYAVQLARALGAEVVVLHAYDLPVIGFPDGALVATPEIATKVTESARIGMEKTLAPHASSGVSMRSLVKQGVTWQTIVETAEELGAGMIVMGTHGRTGLPRALLGSVAEKVVRSAKCPVVTVHRDVPA